MRYLRAANGILRSNAAGSASLRTTSSSLVQTLSQQQAPASHAVTVTATSNVPWSRRPLVEARLFSHTATCQKGKKHKNNRDNNRDDTTTDAANTPQKPTITSTSPSPPPGETDALNPFDFTDLQTAFDRAEKRFTEDLKKLRTGGRFNADVIGAIPVQPDKKSPQQTFPLRELATVAPLGGRRWSILAFEEASVKPIISAVQRSDEFNQQPQRSEENPLELTMTVEPERADALAKRAKEVCQAWRTKVRDEAHRRGELHKKWRGEGVVLSDDAHKLKDRLQKLQDERMKGILGKEKEVVGAIMARGG
ncbi:ribosome recycling factor-domain-containing protein [Parachaetomium inaequale]|uniref:Ribosome recycling factor-domain-containing protein n=1 Tax=Parachaetomium inaequale TaxID=2588326 RepID=A0AAN6P685_9PEZI|nr:ribosome recycling factor-domain-containing protein [Parachaetomium inaequale]